MYTIFQEDASNMDHVSCFEVQDLYMFMGRELEAMDSVPAGNVLGNISTTIRYPTYHLRQEYLMYI